jgi:hypothetical protein
VDGTMAVILVAAKAKTKTLRACGGDMEEREKRYSKINEGKNKRKKEKI